MSPAVVWKQEINFENISGYWSLAFNEIYTLLIYWFENVKGLAFKGLELAFRGLESAESAFSWYKLAFGLSIIALFTAIYCNKRSIIDYEEEIKSTDGSFFVRHDKSNVTITKQVCEFLKKHRMWFPRLNFIFVQLIDGGTKEKFHKRRRNGGLGAPEYEEEEPFYSDSDDINPDGTKSTMAMPIPIPGYYPACPLLTFGPGGRQCYVQGAVPAFGPVPIPIPPPRSTRRLHSRHSRPLRIGLDSIAECDTEPECYNAAVVQTLTPPLLSPSSSSLTNSSWSSDIDESVSCSSSATDYSKTSSGSGGSQAQPTIRNRTNPNYIPPIPVWTYQNYYQPVWLYRGKNDEATRTYIRDRMPVDNGYEDYCQMDQQAWETGTAWTTTTTNRWKSKLHKVGDWKTLKSWLRRK